MAKIIRFSSLESSGPITANNGTLTASVPVLDLSQTWNNAAVTFTSLRLSVTNTASGASSLMTDFRVGGVTIFSVQADGTCVCNTFSSASTPVIQAGYLTVANNAALRWYTSGLPTTQLWSGGSDTLEMRRGTNAQTIRIYRTYTDASNYERGFLKWNTTTNILELGVEAAGTGSVRNVKILTTALNNHIALGTSSSGFGVNGDGSPAMVVNSTERLSVSASLLTLQNDANFGIAFSSTAGYLADTFIRRDGTGNTLAMRNSGNGQTFRLYRTFTDSSNYERLAITSTGTTRFGILAQNAGTGSARQIEISYYTSSSDPTSTDITSGTFGVWKNSGTGTIKLWANDGGTMKSVALV